MKGNVQTLVGDMSNSPSLGGERGCQDFGIIPEVYGSTLNLFLIGSRKLLINVEGIWLSASPRLLPGSTPQSTIN